VAARVVTPSGDVRELPMEWTVERDGEYRASFRADEEGVYDVQVEARRGDAELGRDAVHVQAAELPVEYFGSEMRSSLLRRIAEETGGRFYTAETAASLPEDISYSGSGATVVERKELWDAPVLFFMAVALLGSEWALRKRWGLA
jgi:hypothetical protein